MTTTKTAIEAFIVPLNKLALDPKNVRKTYSKDGIEELAATIRTDNYRLLQNLVVRKAEKKGHFYVTAGGRRLYALNLLLELGEIAKDFGVECKERSAEDAVAVSFTENMAREDMHPVDQFEAYRAMAEAGKPIADIAARFGKTETFVRGRLALARVSPVLLNLYREEELTFEQLTAFTLTDDHDRQVELWDSLPYYNRQPHSIRRALQGGNLSSNDKRIRFIGGLEAYEAQGGDVRRDLFDDSNSGYATDIALVEKLFTAKLEEEAGMVRSEGWAWVECCDSLPNTAYAMTRVYPEPIDLTEEQQIELDAIDLEYLQLSEKCEEGEATEADIDRLEVVEKRKQELTELGEAYAPSDIEQAGCFVYVNYYGDLIIERGLIKPEDNDGDDGNDESNRPSGPHDTEASPKPDFTLPAAFVQELSAQKTAAIRAELAHNSTVALASVVHALLLPLYNHHGYDQTALEITLKSASLEGCIKDAAEAKAIQTMDNHTAELRAKLPENPADLWDHCLTCNQSDLLNLLAYAAGQSLNAVQMPHYERSKQRDHADKVAVALGMDMRDWFTPTAANYFSRISKTGIEAALAEAKGADFARGVSGMKKADAAAYAERHVAGTGWLPSQICLATDTLPDIDSEFEDDDDDDHDHADDFNDDLVTEFPQAAE